MHMLRRDKKEEEEGNFIFLFFGSTWLWATKICGIQKGNGIIIVMGFLINVQVQGQNPLQWAPFQVAG